MSGNFSQTLGKAHGGNASGQDLSLLPFDPHRAEVVPEQIRDLLVPDRLGIHSPGGAGHPIKGSRSAAGLGWSKCQTGQKMTQRKTTESMSSETWTSSSVFLDTNILVLLIVGFVDSTQVGRGKTTSDFTIEQFEQLSFFLDSRNIVVTPHIFTETSNLLKRDERCMVVLRRLMDTVEERSMDAKTVAQHPRLLDVGVSDAVLLHLISPATPLLTNDRQLWALANAKKIRAALFPVELLD